MNTIQRILRPAAAAALAAALSACGSTGMSPGGGQPSGGLYGVVTKFRGTPVAGATVRLEETAQQASTDSSGRFRIQTDYRGPGTVSVSAPGYAPLRIQVAVGDGVEKRLRLVRPADYDPRLAWELAALTSDPYGVGDPDVTRWPGPVIVYTVDRSPPWNSNLDRYLVEAAEHWTMATAGAYRVVEGTSQFYIAVKATHAPCGRTDIMGCGDSYSGNGIWRAFVEVKPTAGVDVVAHELGHAMGFPFHTDRLGYLMYRGGGVYPATDDEAAVFCVLYAAPVGARFSQLAVPDPPRCAP
ncbi:MAG: carboxypeptidase regulatory-like domain-containing protein [Armatimonadota bacterium]|nr:carboxypeptidase regulatory-like domain-containing protein [Armatimonadota bacterium]